MRRVLAVTQNFPDDRHVMVLKNPNFADRSRLATAKALMENASKYLTAENNPTPYSGIMSTLRGKLNNAGRTYWGEFGGEQYIEDLAQNAIAQMAKRNFRQRGLTDYEKYMIALARQRRQSMAKNQNVIPFPKQD